MPWLRDGTGLRLTGIPHYDAAEIGRLVGQLRQSRNQPQKVCGLIEQLLASQKASKELIWRLSKWCHWDDPSQEIARAIAAHLFNGQICRRLRDQADHPIPDRRTAEADYQKWLNLVC
jgi:hypothetical protein